MDIVDLLVTVSVALWAFLSLIYLISLFISNARVVDVTWGLGFLVVLLVVQYSVNDSFGLTASFALIWQLIIIWATRLSLHSALRFKINKEEWRYRTLRKAWKDNFWWQSYFKIFLVKGFLIFLISLPIVVSVYDNGRSGRQLLFAGLIWSAGFIYEVVADWQLAKYKSVDRNKQKILKAGLWRYSRHPNFFGEILMWWGIFIAVAGGPYWWLALLSPVTLTIMILSSSVSALEGRWKRSKQYKAYTARTNSVIPWLAKLKYRE
jgi:steroid 5-alpha reductase family enzyme